MAVSRFREVVGLSVGWSGRLDALSSVLTHRIRALSSLCRLGASLQDRWWSEVGWLGGALSAICCCCLQMDGPTWPIILQLFTSMRREVTHLPSFVVSCLRSKVSQSLESCSLDLERLPSVLGYYFHLLLVTCVNSALYSFFSNYFLIRLLVVFF